MGLKSIVPKTVERGLGNKIVNRLEANKLGLKENHGTGRKVMT